MTALRTRLTQARAATDPAVADRARRGLTAFADASAAQGAPAPQIAAQLADGSAALGIARMALSATPTPKGIACAQGCAFCCILTGADGGTISQAEAQSLHAALTPLKGQPDGRQWHANACTALDPDTRTCRAYDARPVICRAYVSTDAAACESVANGTPAPGPGTLGPYHTHLAALALSRAALKGTARVATYSLARLAAAATEGRDLDAALSAARHNPAELDAELRRSKRDLARARP